MVAQLREPLRLIPDPRNWQGPGCTERCNLLAAHLMGTKGRQMIERHDPASHEAYGRSIGLQPGNSVYDIVTGNMIVRLSQCAVLVDGRDVLMTPHEYGVLRTLAQNIGHVLSHDDLLSMVWGPDYIGEHHLLRVNIARIRARLGTARHLLVTRPGMGYRLAAEPYTGPAL